MIKKVIPLVLCILVRITVTIQAQSPADVAYKFIDFSLASDTLNIKAMLFVPDNYNPEITYPVVMTLHGLGECGDDNYRHILYNNLATTWGMNDFQAEHPCFIYSPQCPTGANWLTTSVHRSAMFMLDSLIEKYSIDTNRIYITGLSLGGMGTWSYLVDHHDIFAAAIPVCGALYGGPEERLAHIDLIKDIPVWNFHGGVDGVVQTYYSRAIVGDYKMLGKNPVLTHAFGRLDFDLSEEDLQAFLNNHTDLLYSEPRNVGHFVWDYAYLDETVKEWLFTKRKPSLEAISVDHAVHPMFPLVVTENTEFSYSVSEEVDSVGVWYARLDTAGIEFVSGMKPGSESFEFITEGFEDFFRSWLIFMAFDSTGNVIGKAGSRFFTIDREGNSPPYIELLNDLALFTSTPSSKTYEMKVLVGDPESDELNVTYAISLDDGASFEDILTKEAENADISSLLIKFEEHLKVDKMIIRASVSDGEYTESVQTLSFKNRHGWEVSVPSLHSNCFKIYPNPARNKIHVEFMAKTGGRLECVLVSLDGRIIERKLYDQIQAGKCDVFLDVSTVIPGNYILNIELEGMNQLSKSIVIN